MPPEIEIEPKAKTFLSIEIIITMCVSLVAIAVSWGALNADVQANQAAAKDVKVRQENINAVVRVIERDVATMKTEQKHLIQQQTETKSELRYIRNLLEREFDRQNGARPDD